MGEPSHYMCNLIVYQYYVIYILEIKCTLLTTIKLKRHIFNQNVYNLLYFISNTNPLFNFHYFRLPYIVSLPLSSFVYMESVQVSY